jgi:hypothetical protein
MNWYKKAQPEDNEPWNDPNQEPLGKKIFEHHGVWQYPFNQVQKGGDEGWFINWFDSQGGIPDVDSVNIGDKVADSALNMTPYWEVNFVDAGKGLIFLTPIEPNPFISGIGAGGKQLTDWDMEIHSGEYESKRIDQILLGIQEGTATDPNDVAYLLKGTVPLQMGPNGAQGGWYHPGEMNHNRGGREGMRPKDIMMFDAKSLQKMGYATPIAALDGTMDLDDWKDYVQSNGSGDVKESYQSEGENYNDPQTSSQFILNHPQPSIKHRNYKALKELYNPEPKRLGYGEKRPDDFDYTGWYENHNKEWEAHRQGEMVNKELEPLLKQVTGSIADMTHPAQDKLNFDKYWYLKEDAIQTAGEFKWMDILTKFENSYDKTNRKYVAIAYSKMNQPDKIRPMIFREKDEESKQDMIYWFGRAGKE